MYHRLRFELLSGRIVCTNFTFSFFLSACCTVCGVLSLFKYCKSLLQRSRLSCIGTSQAWQLSLTTLLPCHCSKCPYPHRWWYTSGYACGIRPKFAFTNCYLTKHLITAMFCWMIEFMSQTSIVSHDCASIQSTSKLFALPLHTWDLPV